MIKSVAVAIAVVAFLCVETVGRSQENGMQPGQIIRDCLDCPEMVVMPSGSFLMGSSEADAKKVLDAYRSHQTDIHTAHFLTERPQHSVTIPRAFGMAKYPVTRGEFAAFVRETGYSSSGCTLHVGHSYPRRPDAGWAQPGFSQTDRDPAVCVNWYDAQAYVAWLNKGLAGQVPQATIGPYRLPSEAEWEYGARAGTQTMYWWGDSIGSGNANCDGCGTRWDGKQTAPVDEFRANPFGLSNMLGNVWEWTEDCWHSDYAGAPADGSAWTVGDECGIRVMRGGDFSNDPWVLLPTNRTFPEADRRYSYVGFRVAKTLP
jgi:formylglycine-generating enzyme required for sulfatase activity